MVGGVVQGELGRFQHRIGERARPGGGVGERQDDAHPQRRFVGGQVRQAQKIGLIGAELVRRGRLRRDGRRDQSLGPRRRAAGKHRYRNGAHDGTKTLRQSGDRRRNGVGQHGKLL